MQLVQIFNFFNSRFLRCQIGDIFYFSSRYWNCSRSKTYLFHFLVTTDHFYFWCLWIRMSIPLVAVDEDRHLSNPLDASSVESKHSPSVATTVGRAGLDQLFIFFFHLAYFFTARLILSTNNRPNLFILNLSFLLFLTFWLDIFPLYRPPLFYRPNFLALLVSRQESTIGVPHGKGEI